MQTINKLSIGIIVALLLMTVTTFFLNQSTKPAVNLKTIGETYQLGNYQVQIKLNPEKPKTGNNQLTIAIRNEKDQPVIDAKVEGYAEMPAMGSMQAMREIVSIENTGAGLYQGNYALPMNGSWPITLTIESKKLALAKAVFDMNTSRTGLKLTLTTPSQQLSQSNQSTVSEQSNAEFNVDNFRRQLIGVTTAKVICQRMIKTLHAGAKVTYNQSQLTDISLKYDAWIDQLNADYLGKQIRQGDTLFTVYSPELISAQDEYLDSLKQGQSYLQKVTRKRLKRWGINTTQIKSLQQRGIANEYVSILSPVDGTVIEKNIVAGSAVKVGSSLLRLANLSSVWVDGEVYESDLPWLKIGMEAQITFPELPEQAYTAKVSFIDSVINPKTHSAVIRVQLPNHNALLKPGMFANMNLQIDLGERLIVPEQAVIYAGHQRIVFIDKGNGRLLPRKIKTGLRNTDMIEVLDGLKYGDDIVSSGNFLIAAESKLKSGLAQW